MGKVIVYIDYFFCQDIRIPAKKDNRTLEKSPQWNDIPGGIEGVRRAKIEFLVRVLTKSIFCINN